MLCARYAMRTVSARADKARRCYVYAQHHETQSPWLGGVSGGRGRRKAAPIWSVARAKCHCYAPNCNRMRTERAVCPQNSKQKGLGMRGRARRIIPCFFISPGAWSPGCTGWERPFQHWPCCSPQAPPRPRRTGTRAPQRSRSQTSASVAPVTTPAATKIMAGAGQARSVTVSTHKRGTAAALGAVCVHCA